MDFFPITVSEMPIKPNGDIYTKVELFNYIRTHINDFFDDLTFTPVVDVDFNIDESNLWLSNNPLGTIINIDITGNNGSVVCSDYNSSNGNWIFSTITTPWVNTHPVSGNRAFGFYTDINGNMVIYTRGVDRLTDGTHRYSLVGVLAEILQENIGFAEADAKWTNFQNKVMTFITSGQASGDNGQAAVNIPVKNRPNWNKVKEVLMGTRPVSDLGCN